MKGAARHRAACDLEAVRLEPGCRALSWGRWRHSGVLLTLNSQACCVPQQEGRPLRPGLCCGGPAVRHLGTSEALRWQDFRVRQIQLKPGLSLRLCPWASQPPGPLWTWSLISETGMCYFQGVGMCLECSGRWGQPASIWWVELGELPLHSL